MGWTLERYRASSLYEFNLAAAGYWRNWERFTKWAVREINYIAITGNPNIKPHAKPKAPGDLYELSIDNKKKEKRRLSDNELKKIKKRLHESKNTMAKG